MTPPTLHLEPTRGEGRRRLGVAASVGFVVHLALGVVVYHSPKPDPKEPEKVERTRVRTFEKKVQLKPKRMERIVMPVPPPPPPPPPPPDEPPPELEKLPEKLAKLETNKDLRPQEAAPKRAPRVKKKNQKKKKTRKKKTPRTPRTLSLPNLGGNSRIKIPESEGQSLGDPNVPATPASSAREDGPKGKGKAGSRGTAPTAVPAAPAPKRKPVFRAPRVKRKIRGKYPPSAPKTGRNVSITVSIVVAPTGRVTDARVVSKPRIAGTFFDAEAVRVARRTTFLPATLDGKPVKHRISYVVVFKPTGQ